MNLSQSYCPQKEWLSLGNLLGPNAFPQEKGSSSTPNLPVKRRYQKCHFPWDETPSYFEGFSLGPMLHCNILNTMIGIVSTSCSINFVSWVLEQVLKNIWIMKFKSFLKISVCFYKVKWRIFFGLHKPKTCFLRFSEVEWYCATAYWGVKCKVIITHTHK